MKNAKCKKTISKDMVKRFKVENEQISNKLTQEYGSGFNRSAIFRMIKFYEEFPDVEIVATLSQQFSWSHFVELLPIED
ncbi:MAG: hypothetical protein IJR08_03500 [Bacilli bacterium]|nr:hypothetical protein [Bacilli bacterium]